MMRAMVIEKNLSFEEAASIPLVGLTSYQVLHDLLQLSAGQKVLIQAETGRAKGRSY